MLAHQFRLFLRSITLINVSPGMEIFLWIISNFQHASAIIAFLIRFLDAMSLPVVSTITNYLSLNCTQQDLYHVFPFFFALSVLHSLIFLILVILFCGWYDFVLNFSKIRDLTRSLAAYHNSLFYIMSSSVLSLYLLLYHSGTLPSDWILSETTAKSLVPVAIFCLLLNIAFMVATSLFTFNPAFGTLTSRRPSMIDTFRLISKSVLLLYNILSIPLGHSAGWVVGMIVILCEVAIIYLLTADCPFYNQTSTETQAFFSSVNTSLLVVHFVYMTVDPQNISPLLMWISFCGMIFSFLRYKLSIKPGELVNDKHEAPSQARSFRKLSKIATILKDANISLTQLKNDNSVNVLILKGLISKHRKNCPKEKCFCKIYDDNRIAINKTDLENTFNKFTENILKEFWKENIQENPNNNAWLKLTFAELILKYNISQFALAITYLNSISSGDVSIHLALETERLLRYIKNHIKKLVSNETHDVNMILFLEYKQAASKFKKDVIENTNTIVNFWEEYQENIPFLLKLFKFASKANKSDEAIDSSWAALKKKYNNQLVEEHLFFAAYCFLVKNKETMGAETMKEYQKKIHHFLIQTKNVEKVTQLTIIEKSNIVITMNMNKAKLGKIVEIRGNISALGFSPIELKDSKINAIIPPYVAMHHDQYLLNHLEFGKFKMLNNNVSSHALHKLGHIFPIYSYVAPSPNVDKAFNYIGVIRPIAKYEEYMIIARDTTILGYTEVIGELFGLKAENLNKTKLTQFCSILKHLNKFLETYDWVLRNLSEQEKAHYTIVKKKIEEYIVNNPHEVELLQIPQSEKEYEYLYEIKEKFDREGWPLDFITTEKIQKFSCTSVEDNYFTSAKIRKFTMKHIDVKSVNNIRKQSKKFSVKRVSVLPKKDRLIPETADPSFIEDSERRELEQNNNDPFEEQSEIQFDDIDIENPSTKIKQQKIDLTFISEKRIDSFEETFQNASFPEEITVIHSEKKKSEGNRSVHVEISMTKSQGNKSIGGETDKSYKGVSFLENFSMRNNQSNMDAVSENSERERYQRKKTPRLSTFVEGMRNKIYVTKEATRSVENFGSFSEEFISLHRQDRQEAYMNLVQQSRMNGKVAMSMSSSVSPGNFNSSMARRMEKAINSPIKDKQIACLGIMIVFFYIGLISALFAFNFYSKKNLSDISYILTGLRAASNRLNSLLFFNYHVRKIDLVADELFTELYPGFIEDQRAYAMEKILEFVPEIELYSPPIFKTYSVVHEDDVLDLMEPCEMKPAIEDEAIIYVTLDKAISIFETDSMIIFEKNGIDAEKELDMVLVNALDDVLIRSESVSATYLDHLRQLIEYIQEYLRSFVICQGVFTGLLIVYTMIIELNQIKFRNRFFEALIKIDSLKYKSHFECIKDFKALAEEKLMIGRESELQKKIKKIKIENKQQEKFTRRKYNSAQVHLVSLFRLILQLCILTIMITSSGSVYNVVVNQTSSLRTSCDNLVDVTYMLEKIVLVISTIDNYLMREPSNTLRNEPIDIVLWQELDYLTLNQRFYTEATTTKEPDPEIMAIAQSDMCERYKGKYDSTLDCYQIADASLKYGVSAMYSYIIENVRTLLEKFDSTNRNQTAQMNIIKTKEYRTLTTLVENFVVLPHNEMLDVIQTLNTNLSDNNNTFIWVTNVVYLLVAFLFAFISININNRISQEKLETKRMLNMIPIHTILETPMLAIYVEKDNRIRF